MTLEDETVEDFLSHVKELEERAADEDFRRSQKLESELRSYKGHDIAIPRPVGRVEKSGISNSESFQDFNKSVSKEYRVDLNDLAHESAYNYDKSSRNNIPTSTYVPKKRDDMPEVIKFDDFTTTKKPYKSTQSRYSKFVITDEKRHEIDETLSALMGKSLTIDNDQENEVESVAPLVRTHKGGNFIDNDDQVKPLVRERKGGSFKTEWASEAQSKPKLAPPVKVKPSYLQQTTPVKPSSSYSGDNDLNSLKKSPRKFGLSTKAKPEIKPKPDSLKFNSSVETPKSFMDSVITHTTSTSQSISTKSKVQIPSTYTKNGNSWLDSAQKHTPVSNTTSSDVNDKVRILPSKKNKAISPKPSKAENSEESEFKSLPLKKVRPVVPSKPNALSDASLPSADAEFLQKKLSPTKSIDRKVSDVPEALRKSKSLKPPVPKRKPSLQITEALDVKNKLKQKDLSIEKPAEEKPEGLVKLNNLKPSKPIRKPSLKELEAIENLNKIKSRGAKPPPVKPKNSRVTSQSKEILKSHLDRLKPVSTSVKSDKANLTKRADFKEPSPPTLPKRKTSIETTSDTSETSGPISDRDEYKNNLQQLLLRKVKTTTDSTLLSTSNRTSALKDEFYPIKKAATFDTGLSASDKEVKLEHINAKRARGPKRRAPKSIK